MKRLLLAAGSLLAILVVVVLLYLSWRKPAEYVDQSRGWQENASASTHTDLANPSNPTSTRQGEEEIQDTAPAPQTQQRASFVVRGRTVNLEGARAAGLDIILLEGSSAGGIPLGQTAGDGGFLLELSRGGTLVARGLDYVTIQGAEVSESTTDEEHLILVCNSMTVRGQVVDPKERPLLNAEIECEIPMEAYRASLPTRDGAVQWFAAETNSDGRFSLVVPVVEGGALRVAHDGFREVRVHLQYEDKELKIVLGAIAENGRVLAGRVVDINHAPIPEVHVSLGTCESRTDTEGRFVMPLPKRPLPLGLALVAAKQGLQPTVVANFSDTLPPVEEQPSSVELTLNGIPLEIAGRILDLQDSPLSGWRVTPLDPTLIVESRIPPVSLESIASGDSLVIGTNNVGDFRLKGLLDRDYMLQAWDPSSLDNFKHGPVHAGTTDLVLRCAVSRAHITGQVVSWRGRPVPNVGVWIALPRHSLPDLPFGGICETGKGTTTDEHGRFELLDVPFTNLQLNVSADNILPAFRPLEEDGVLNDVHIVVEECLRFQILGPMVGTGPQLVARVLDADGKTLTMVISQSNQWTVMPAYLISGTSPVLTVSERAEVLVISRAGETLEHIPLQFEPGRVIEVDVDR